MFISLSVQQITDALSCTFMGENKIITGVNTLKSANQNQISFYSNVKYKKFLQDTNAAACLIRESDANLLPNHVTKILCKDPYLAYAHVLNMLRVPAHQKPDVASSAYISSQAKIGKNCTIQHCAFIDDEAEIGDNCVIGPCTHIGKKVKIGNDVMISSSVTLIECEIGNKCIIHAGVRIGQDGFGFTLNEQNQLMKIQQIGKVIIGNSVEIGANTSIDRGAIDNTIIGNNTKIDNLVQIGHNVIIGQNCIICGQVGLAGSTVIGDYVMIGGQAGLGGHIEIGSMAQIAAQSGVMRDLAAREKVGGSPAIKITDWHKQTIFLQNAIKS